MNIITNGGFESGMLSPGWRQTPGSATLDGGVTDTTSHTGNYCLELGALDFVEQTFFIARATGDLTFRAKAASAANPGPFYVRIEYRDGSESLNFLTLSMNWEEFSYSVDNSKLLSRIQFGTGEREVVYIDNVYLDGFKTYPAAIDFRYPRNIAHRGFLYPYDSPWSMLQPEMLEEQGIFEYATAMEDRLAQIENRLTELTSMLSVNQHAGEGWTKSTKPKGTAKKSSRKGISEKQKKTK
jgi:hypothetical protein